MSETALKDWVGRNSAAAGVLAFAIYAPGKESFIQPCVSGLTAHGLENALRCVAETIPVLQLNHFPTARFRFVYGDAVVHCERRKDGICLGIFAQRSEAACPPRELDRLIAEFHRVT